MHNLYKTMLFIQISFATNAYLSHFSFPTLQKDIEEGNANKGVMFSAILYIIGIVSHLLSK